MIRRILAKLPAGRIEGGAACTELGLSRSRFYQLYGDYRTGGLERDQTWLARTSGGNHVKEWPVEVRALLRERLSSQPPSSYSSAASKVLRKHLFRLDRAQVCRSARSKAATPGRLRRPGSVVGEFRLPPSSSWLAAHFSSFTRLRVAHVAWSCLKLFTGGLAKPGKLPQAVRVEP